MEEMDRLTDCILSADARTHAHTHTFSALSAHNKLHCNSGCVWNSNRTELRELSLLASYQLIELFPTVVLGLLRIGKWPLKQVFNARSSSLASGSLLVLLLCWIDNLQLCCGVNCLLLSWQSDCYQAIDLTCWGQNYDKMSTCVAERDIWLCLKLHYSMAPGQK